MKRRAVDGIVDGVAWCTFCVDAPCNSFTGDKASLVIRIIYKLRIPNGM